MRLIDADELISYLNSVAGCFDSTSEVEDNTIEAIESAPTIDAVPVVRCKDCKWWDGIDGTACAHPDYRNPIHCLPDEFCNCGERKNK
jgi:hypothetical protein